MDHDYMEHSSDEVPGGDHQQVANENPEDAMIIDDNMYPKESPPIGPKPAVKPRTKAPPRTTLRVLSLSKYHFWKNSHSEQLSQTMYDKKSDGSAKPLPENEVTVMALNEIAATQGAGFFSHLKADHVVVRFKMRPLPFPSRVISKNKRDLRMLEGLLEATPVES